MKTYIVKVDGSEYVDVYEEALNGYSTSRNEADALVLTYAEAVELSFKINKSAGRIDKAVMVEAIEEDEEYEAEDDRDEHQKRADAMAERADDSRDDELL